MIQIKDTIVSLDLITEFFCCDVEACHGDCCMEGDGGAPLNPDEEKEIARHLSQIKPHMSKEGIEAVEAKGISYHDSEGDLVTQLNDNGCECSFAYKKNGLWLCSVETAHNSGKCPLRKPVSCWLYPVRLKTFPTFVAVEYHRWNICKQARQSGLQKDIRLYQFLKDPLIFRFGEDWYDELCLTAEEYLKFIGEKQH